MSPRHLLTKQIIYSHLIWIYIFLLIISAIFKKSVLFINAMPCASSPRTTRESPVLMLNVFLAFAGITICLAVKHIDNMKNNNAHNCYPLYVIKVVLSHKIPTFAQKLNNIILQRIFIVHKAKHTLFVINVNSSSKVKWYLHYYFPASINNADFIILKFLPTFIVCVIIVKIYIISVIRKNYGCTN